ncbi:uncharacterized protein EI90DRAFT_3012281 [Cantharellus anzutake]|uniref:uncharacterized protein n=1 Tax=Cantharellus anzutake TaxID=1750568 RepID=UPI00190863C8|nr:uncharacterized protein EI90DRAFT_3012281 [Cantharellus anzutake]KAF8340404.1 hypothetical protein EI90DRAFT_3012281 [Cantharellus anzutake]
MCSNANKFPRCRRARRMTPHLDRQFQNKPINGCIIVTAQSAERDGAHAQAESPNTAVVNLSNHRFDEKKFWTGPYWVPSQSYSGVPGLRLDTDPMEHSSYCEMIRPENTLEKSDGPHHPDTKNAKKKNRKIKRKKLNKGQNDSKTCRQDFRSEGVGYRRLRMVWILHLVESDPEEVPGNDKRITVTVRNTVAQAADKLNTIKGTSHAIPVKIKLFLHADNQRQASSDQPYEVIKMSVAPRSNG